MKPFMRLFALTVPVVGLTAACARVSVRPVDPRTGQIIEGASDGVRYYLPKPYLLVAEVPVDKSKAATSSLIGEPAQSKVTGRKGGAAKPTGQAQAGGAAPSGAAAKAPSGDSPSPTSDTSFAMTTQQYAIKLVYLPDYSRPMAISENPGLIGSSSMKPALQDGWMLTSLDASGDTKVAETLNAIASIAASLHGGGAAAAAGSSKKAGGAAKGGGEAAAEEAEKSIILQPGIYEFEFGSGGEFVGLCRVVTFEEGRPNNDPTHCGMR